MNTHSAVYWTTTTLTAFAFLTGGAAYLFHADFAVAGVSALGYPAYVVTLLGAWKVLGSVAILAPRLPRLKEWAYAGIVFNLTGAAFSHAAMSHPAGVIAPLVILGIVGASWALRPADRTLGAATGESRADPSRRSSGSKRRWSSRTPSSAAPVKPSIP
jgi:hypothetical protein